MIKKRPTIAITGANGFLGSELTKYFIDQGWRVIALVRGSQRFTSTDDIRYVEYDLSTGFDSSVLQQADYLIHAAYSKQGANGSEIFQTNLKAAEQIVTAARAHKLKKMVFVSSMSAHESAESIYGRQKLAIEKLFQGADCAIVRPGLIIGNGGIVKQMFHFMRSKHMVPLIGGGKQPLQIVAVYDLVKVLATIINNRHSGLFTIATPKVYSYKSFYATLSSHFSIKVLFIPVPFNLLMGVFKLTALLHIPMAVGADNLLGLKHLQSVDTREDLVKLGLRLDPLKKALSKLNIS